MPDWKFSRFRCLTFDCYGTLIDWETGILAAVRRIFPGLNATDAEILQAYSELESKAESGEYLPYREVLAEVTMALGIRFRMRARGGPFALAESIKDWKPFPDTVEALRRLKSRYQLAIISNIDDELFAHSAKWLEVPFDHVITAQQVGSYKPTIRNFETAIERIALPKEQILHCAESLFHDVVPARKLGIANVWVNRRAGRGGVSASGSAEVTPDLTVTSLKELADLAGV